VPAALAWRTVVPPIAVPGAYLDVGFAGNGDLLVVGTDRITDPKLRLWIARFRTDGTRPSKETVDRRIGLINADWIDVDPSDDTVVFLERQADTTFIARRVSAATGDTVASVRLHRSVAGIAIDSRGRTFASTPHYGTASNRRPCMLVRLRAGGEIAEGVDHFLKPCETLFQAGGQAHFSAPYEIGVGASGNLVFVDEHEDAAGHHIGLRIVVVTPGWEFVRAWPLPFEWSATDLAYGPTFSSFIVAGTSRDGAYLGETLTSDDGSRSVGYRLRQFGPNGEPRGTLGVGGDQAGTTWPSHPQVDGADRLWIIDLDTAARAYSIKVRE
jgi:hypothetical protein